MYYYLKDTHIVGVVYVALGFQRLQLHVDGADQCVRTQKSPETT